MGAGLAFAAALDRYPRQHYILLNYHVHIPQPDPMVNPSTLDRQRFYGVRSSPSYFIDGDADGGGGSAEGAASLYEQKVEPVVEKHLAVAPEAAIRLRAKRSGAAVSVNASVSNVRSQSGGLRLQIALVEDLVSYSGENGNRLHEMVVRSLAALPPTIKTTPAATPAPPAKPAPPATTAPPTRPAQTPPAVDETDVAATPTEAVKPGEAAKPAGPPAQPQGFALRPGKGGSFEYTFDLAKVVADAKAHLEDFETNTRKGTYTFRQKKHEIDASKLSVVAFVQDETTKKILQAVYVKVPAAETSGR